MLRSAISKIETEQRILKVKVPGDGDCLYHAIAVDIIHDVLTDAITADSSTGQAFMRHAPKLAEQLAKEGISVDFRDKNLKQVIVALLQALPLDSADMPAVSAEDTEDTEETRAIKQCDLHRLLTRVTAPFLRTIMHEGMFQHKDIIFPHVKEVLKNEFSAYLLTQKGEELGFNDDDAKRDDEIVAAKNYLASGEFAHVPTAAKEQLFAVWNQAYASTQANVRTDVAAKSSDEKISFVNGLFDNWWNTASAETAVNLYASLHTQTGVYASSPQREALAAQLQCNIAVLNQHDARVVPITRNIPQGRTLLVSQHMMHFDAMVGNPDLVEPAKISTVLHETPIVARAPKAKTGTESKTERAESPKRECNADWKDSATSETIRDIVIRIRELKKADELKADKIQHERNKWAELIEKAKTAKPAAGESLVEYTLTTAEKINVTRATQVELDMELVKKLQIEEYEDSQCPASPRPASPHRR